MQEQEQTPDSEEAATAKVFALERPHPNLMLYYALASLLLGPLFFLILLPASFRYHTLRYRFDEEGVSMRWGLLFRREVSLTYTRIQDIHLASNAVERWLGLARVQIQTASGAAGAEMTIEGLQEFELVRDFLYARMRGVREHTRSRTGAKAVGASAAVAAGAGELGAVVEALREVTRELHGLRTALAARPPRPGGPGA